MDNPDHWYHLEEPQVIDSPALLVFPDRVKQNIRTAIAMVGDVNRLRPHIKTCKSAEAVKLMMDAGITKFKCATIAEAELLGMVNAKDVLLAYQPAGPKLKRFIELIRKYPRTRYSNLVDSISTAIEQATAFQQAGITQPVYIDINVGMNRTGIKPGPAVLELMKFLLTNEDFLSVGLHVYDGHLRNPDIRAREMEVNDCFRPVEELLKEFSTQGWPAPTVVTGGSPTFPVHAGRAGVECSPGTFVYWDKGYSTNCPEQEFLPAVVILSRIISRLANGFVTTDLGHKSVASENELSRRVFFMDAPDLTPVSQSEEHLVLQCTSGKEYSVGDILYGIPWHICPTVALYERLVVIIDGKPSGEWKNIARDRMISI